MQKFMYTIEVHAGITGEFKEKKIDQLEMDDPIRGLYVTYGPKELMGLQNRIAEWILIYGNEIMQLHIYLCMWILIK